MTTAELLAELRGRSVTMTLEGDRVRVSAPRGALTPELQSAMAARKPEIIALLRQAHAPQSVLPPLQRMPRDGHVQVSFGQQRLWFLQELDPASAAYTIASSIRFGADVDPAVIGRALTEVVRRHESLRTSFPVMDGEPVQAIAPPAPVSLPVVDLRHLDPESQEAETTRIWKDLAQHAFDLASGPPITFVLIRQTGHASLLVTQHHIITDRWSLGLFMRELGAACEHVIAGTPLPPEPAIQYADFALWQRAAMQTPAYREHLEYWKRQLAAPLTIVDLPLDRPRPPVQTYAGAWETRPLATPVREAALTLAQGEGVTPFMVFLAAFGALLSRYAGQEDILIGSPIAGRTAHAVESVIGCFVNTLVMRLDLSGRPGFRELLKRTREVALDAYAHQDMPFEHLVAELHPQRDISRSPIFQVAFNFQNQPKTVEVTEEMSITTSGASMFDLSLSLIDGPAGLTAGFEYNVALFDRETIARLIDHYESLLAVVSRYPDLPIAAVPMLGRGERSEMLESWNRTGATYPRDARLQDLLAAQAARTPDRIAVESEGEAITYAELMTHGRRIARRLRELGVRRGDRVGVAVERTARMVPVLLGVLEAGAAYVPLDPAFPVERLAYMADDAQVAVVVTDRASESSLPARISTRVLVDADADVWTLPADAGAAAGSSEDPAYVIYTSGSTGRPKGVQVPHRALVNFLSTMAVQPGMAPDDVLVSVTTLSFDIAGLELFLPLTVGARVVVASRAQATEGTSLLQLLATSGATVMQATPATWRLLIEGGWQGDPAIRMFCGGEALPRDLANALLGRTNVLWNLYGPTETTIWSTVERVVGGDTAISIGRPIGNTQLYVFDAAGQLVPPGVPGELYIGGDGVAHGYLNRPDLTAERFLPDPFAGRPGARMYRTGDIAKFRRDGRVECLGRLDHQIKLRGFRLELGEIEAALVDHEGVRQAVVTMQADAAGEGRLVAFLVAERGAAPTASDLRRHLRTRLPDYMIPSFFMELGALPLTENGKVDRQALPRAFSSSGASEQRTPPRTPTERALAEIWQAVLGIDAVSASDNFFDVGGHSLVSMKVIARIEQAVGVRLNPRDLLLDSLEQIASTIDRRAAARPAAAGRPVALTEAAAESS